MGPYSPAIRYGDLLFVSGQGPRNPATGIVARGIEAETTQVLENVKTIVEGAGGQLADALHARVYLTQMEDFPAMNAVYRRYFPKDPPARTTVAVSALPQAGTCVEIDVLVGMRAKPARRKPERRKTSRAVA